MFPRANRKRLARRGIVIVQVAVGSVMLISFAALAVDVGLLYSVKSELQNAADAAALAGASGYVSDPGLVQDADAVDALVRGRVLQYASLNESYMANGTIIQQQDIILGHYDFNDRYAPLDTSGEKPFNAVMVTARRAPGDANGAVLFFFARIFGMSEGSVSATAIAAMQDQFSGYELEEEEGPDLLPFTMYLPAYNWLLENGLDEYGFDADFSSVEENPDGVREVRLFPWKESGKNGTTPNTEPSDGAGNFGILDFGGGSASVVSDQIENGVDASDMEAVMGTSNPQYFDEDGEPVTYDLNGQPGMQASQADVLADRIGDVIGFFVHDQLANPGSNAEYRNVGIRYGRVMDVVLTGSPSNRRVVVQPIAYSGSSISVSETAPSSGGQVGRIMLVR